MMVDDGWKSIVPDDSVTRVRAVAPVAASPSSHPVETALGGSLEDNLHRQLAFLGFGAALPIIEFQSLAVKTGRFEHTKAAHATSFDMALALCKEADAWNSNGVYILHARLHPGVETRYSSPGRWFELPKGGGSTNNDVAARLVLALDFDVHRPTGTSASNEELALSIEMATSAWDYLCENLGRDSLAYIHSGNGRQIHVALDSLPNTPESERLLSGILIGFDAKWSTAAVKVDRKLFDAKRILPACGTVKKKGAPDVAERPHRRTAIVTPEKVRRLSAEDLKSFAREKLFEEIGDEAKLAMNETITGKRRAPPTAPSTPGVAPLVPKEGPFNRVNGINPRDVAEWLNLLSPSGEPTCPGCGESDKGVAVLSHGFKCSHNRCASKGREGFRTNVDLVAEVKGISPHDAVRELAAQFGIDAFAPAPASIYQPPQDTRPPIELPTLEGLLPAAIERAQRRADKREKPIPLPWPSLASHYGGGWWPGVHYICSGTGIGKTAASLQMALFSAISEFPTAYIGLELEDMQIGLRLIAEFGHIPWSPMYTGNPGPGDLDKARGAALELLAKRLPFHPIFSRPQGWPPSELLRLAEAMRARYPEEDGPGSRPIMIVLDFLQIIGEEPGDQRDLRERIGRAAYLMRDVASRLNATVIAISSIARDKYTVLANAPREAGLLFDEGEGGRPINRRLRNPDALVGLGKESGDIEFSGDSVSSISRLSDGNDILWATAKGRATGSTWTPMRFTGFRFEELSDGGATIAATLRGNAQKRAESRLAAEQERLDKRTEDAVAVAKYVNDNPGCSVRSVRVNILSDNSKRWLDARAVLAGGLVVPEGGSKKGLQLNREKLLGVVRRGLDATVEGDRGGSLHGSTEVPRTVEGGPWTGPPFRAGPPPRSTVDVEGSKTTPHRGGRSPRSKPGDVQQLREWAMGGEDPKKRAEKEGWSTERIDHAWSWLRTFEDGYNEDE
jgi:hypothetical protein